MSSRAFASSYALARDWRGAVEACLARLEAPEGANLGFLYLSDQLVDNAKDILAALRRETGIQSWVGSVGLGLCGTGAGAIESAGISVLVGRFPADSFRVFSGRQPLPARADDPPYFAVVHADSHTPDMSELVTDMAAKVSSGFVTGGLSSARGKTLQIADSVLSGGISGVAFAPSVRVATRLTQGCMPLPRRYTVTESDGNIIAKIDHRPALEVYREAVGDLLAQDVRRAAHFILVGLLVAGRDAADYLVRNVIGIDPKAGLLAINETVEAGQALLFCRRDGDAARADMQRMLDELKSSLADEPKGALYFACVGRGANMFEGDAVETEMIRAAFGDLPLAGFFANGEISHDRLYGYTGVLTLFL